MNKFLYATLIFIIFLLGVTNCFAITQDEKLWLALNFQQTVGQNKKWLYFIYSQFRFIKASHPWQNGLAEAGVGYRFIENDTFWIGYRWAAHNPNNGFYQENRLFQQVIHQKDLLNSNRIILRTRLEEIRRSDSSQILIRFRERLAFEIMHKYFNKMTPFFYDEIFVQLHTTNFTANKLVSENRLFIGFNLYTHDNSWWEIGYINQFRAPTPGESQNTMSHILSFTYTFT